MMKKILVGIDGSVRGARALHWAARRASRGGANLELLSVVDSRKVKEAGALIEDVQEAVEANLDKARNFVAKRYPNVQVEMRIAEGEVVENIVDASVGCDLIVLGSHHGISVGDTIGGAKSLRVAVSAAVPTAVIPADWAEDYDGEGVVVGIDPDGSTKQALDFSIAEAIATEQPLRLITGWGLPAWISKPAEAMGGGLGPVGEQYQARLDSLAAVLREEYEGRSWTCCGGLVSYACSAGICENSRRACLRNAFACGAWPCALRVGNAFDVVEPHDSDRDCSARLAKWCL